MMYRVYNQKIDDQGVKILANFDKQKRQDQQANRQERQAENDKQDKRDININDVLLKQLDVKDQQISKLQKALDQQQQLQLAALAENRQLKDHIQKLSGLLESSSSTQKQQSTEKNDNLPNNDNSSHIKDQNDKKDKNGVVDTDEKQKKIHKDKVNNSWWHFWKKEEQTDVRKIKQNIGII